MKLPHWIDDFTSLFFPDNCIVCSLPLARQEKTVCTCCLYEMPRVKRSTGRKTEMEEIFWGRFPIEWATSYFYYTKGSNYGKLLHLLKYHNRPDIGFEMGKNLGQMIIQCPDFYLPDVIIPVPLHPRKLHKRGYNQSEWIAMGMGEVMGIPVDIKTLVRTVFTETQTNKSREQRWDNIKEAFRVTNTQKLSNAHILLIDDVLTTGATFEGCALTLLQSIPGVKISIASMAFAKGA